MTTQGPDEPDETQPFTHRPYGDRGDDTPLASPPGPDGADRPGPPDAPAWPTYGQPSAPSPEPPAGGAPPNVPPQVPPYAPPASPYLPQPQGQAPYGQAPYPPNFAGYGQPVPGYSYAQPLGKATTSMVLGIIAIASLALATVCCVTAPGMLVGPFAIWTGLSARREIDRNPGAYSNRGQAVAGFVMGIVATVLAVAAIALVLVFVGTVDWSSGYNEY